MKILIIEDEEQAYKRLQKLIKEVIPSADIAGIVVSVQSAVAWFNKNPMPELVFMDINLADGSSFEIFKSVNISCPIIFTTAYGEYAVQAFKVNSIDYLLKPVDRNDIEKAIEKMMTLRNNSAPLINYAELIRNMVPVQPSFRERFVIKLGDNLKSVPIEDVAYFFTENKANYLCTREGKKWPIDFNLDQVAEMLNPKKFFRINRQFIISMGAIEEMKSYTRARVIIKLQPPSHLDTIVSVERAGDFRLWLGGES